MCVHDLQAPQSRTIMHVGVGFVHAACSNLSVSCAGAILQRARLITMPASACVSRTRTSTTHLNTDLSSASPTRTS